MEPNKEKKKVSKENSYHYWWDDKNKTKSKDSPNMNAPQKITPSEAKKLSESQKFNNHSQWNSVGTWEEKLFKVEDFQAFIHKHPGKDLFYNQNNWVLIETFF